MNGESPITLCIDPDGRGAWDLVISEETEHVSCATLDDAKRVAYRIMPLTATVRTHRARRVSPGDRPGADRYGIPGPVTPGARA